MFYLNESDLKVFFSDFAQEATYNTFSVNIIFDDTFALQQYYGETNISGNTLMAYVSNLDADSLGFITETILRIDRTNYIIKDVQKNNQGVTALKLVEED